MILIDADILCYRCGWAAEKTKHYVDGELRENKNDAKAYVKFLKENFGHDAEIVSEVELEPLENCLQMVRSALRDMIDKCEYFGEPKLFLTGEGNFRHEIATIKEYKGNRKDMRKPHWYEEIREYLVSHWNAEVVDGQEADDAIGIAAWADYQVSPDISIIVTTDKDLNMIPGYHYDWVKGDFNFINDLEAMKNFYMQVLTGDATDNIPGVKGVGPVKADKLLIGCTTEVDMYDQCVETYAQAYYAEHVDPNMPGRQESILWYEGRDYALDTIHEVASLLWIRREPDEMWKPFKYPLGEDIEQE